MAQQKGAYECVLRDGMSADTHDPAGIYFGTRSGKLYASNDEGASWTAISEALPSICCVKDGDTIVVVPSVSGG